MSNYLIWNETTLQEASESEISIEYDRGYLFTRRYKGHMYQSRSLRIDLGEFSLNSENRRILKKIPELDIEIVDLPMKDYDWRIHKLGKDFYSNKFKNITFSAAKIKELLTSSLNSNFNTLFKFKLQAQTIGYAICYINNSILHYAYPFYDHIKYPSNLGMTMMLKAILHAEATKLKYVYLGTLTRPGDLYKLQFNGLEWFDGSKWEKDLEQAKQVIKE